MRRRVLLSVVAFGLFALAGPIIRALFPPALPPANSRQHITDLVLLVWPTSFLGVGLPVNGRLTLTAYNVIFFAVLGLVLGVIARRRWVVLVAYLATCLLLAAIEAWGAGYALAYFSWSALAAAFFLYALPFWAIGRAVSNPTASPASAP